MIVLNVKMFKWEHWECAGISEEEYNVLDSASPNIMFFCCVCRPKVLLALKFFNELQTKQNSLDGKVKELEERLNLLTSLYANSGSTKIADNTLPVHTDISKTCQNATRRRSAPPKPPPVVSERRFNVVLYGTEESSTDTIRSDCQKHDLKHLLDIMSSLDSSVTAASLKDFYRLGKFDKNNTHARPLLVKFLRSFDATLVLSNRQSLTSGISIKPDLTLQEHKIENALLKERRRLIDSGTERKFIRIRGNSLYLNNKLHGVVQDSEFCLATTAFIATSSTTDNSHDVAQITSSSSNVTDKSQ